MCATSLSQHEDVKEKMWIEIIHSMEELYAELVASHNEVERKKEELEQAYAELRRIQDHLIQSEKMRSLGRMAAGVAHELNNPLGGIIVYAHLLIEDTDDSDARKDNMRKIVAEAERCRDIVKELLGFSRDKVAFGELIDLRGIMENTISVLSSQAMFHNIEIVRRIEEALPPVKGDPGLLQQAFTNVLLNAVQAVEGRGTICIGMGRRGNGYVAVSVSDTGRGIPEENLRKVFEPFFTTAPPGKGTGLGLAITYSIIERHGGRIEVESEPGKGSTFRMLMPAGDASK